MKIAVDLDGVVWDIMGVFVEIYNEMFNKDVKYEDIDDWWFFCEEEFKAVYPLTLPRIMEYPVLDKYVDVYIADLNMYHDVSILTAEVNTIEVLKEKLDSIHIFKGTHYKEIIRIDPKVSKLDYEFDIYIDDKPGMAKDMHKFPERILLLYDQPWNQDFEDEKSDNVWRVYDWDEVVWAIDLIIMNKTKKGKK